MCLTKRQLQRFAAKTSPTEVGTEQVTGTVWSCAPGGRVTGFHTWGLLKGSNILNAHRRSSDGRKSDCDSQSLAIVLVACPTEGDNVVVSSGRNHDDGLVYVGVVIE